jgi:hypothetical protein
MRAAGNGFRHCERSEAIQTLHGPLPQGWIASALMRLAMTAHPFVS